MFTFSLGDLNEQQRVTEYPYRNWEEAYRDKWKWDKKVRGTHVIDCYPAYGACPYWVYTKDGKIMFQEQAGTLPGIEEGVPDMNPMGCQKGACFHTFLDQDQSKERVLYPLKRVGQRGSGKWERISWDQALTEISDAILDALQEQGPESLLAPACANAGAWGFSLSRLYNLLGGIIADFDGDLGDLPPGMVLTWGKLIVTSEDDQTHSHLIIVWQMNPHYTRIPYAHFLYEARYKGAELVLVAPDYSPSAMHMDYHVPVKIGGDPALCLSMGKVIIDEGLVDQQFVKEQTDMPLLVRLDNRRFLRASDIVEGGWDDQFYFYDTKTQKIVEAPRGTLALGDVDPALEGSYTASLKDGRMVEVAPVFQLLKEKLEEYTPEKASAMCEVHPDVIRTLARKIGTRRTFVYEGLGTGKHYHGDLMERAMYLLLALSGNWGKKGTGTTFWAPGPGAGGVRNERARGAGPASTAVAIRGMLDAIKQQDPTMTDEIAAVEMAMQASAAARTTAPPAFWWYRHGGYKELWNNRAYHDPSMARDFDEYFKEAQDKQWWTGVDRPRENVTPLVFMEAGGNMLRRIRGGQSILFKRFWPNLKLIVHIDNRMASTGLFADYVLPAAQQYERVSNAWGGGMHAVKTGFADKAVEPAGESMTEWQMFRLLARKITERAKARGFTEYQHTYTGQTHKLDDLENAYTLDGELADEETIVAESIAASAAQGVIPPDTTIETMREKGFARFIGLGLTPTGLNVAADIKPDSTVAAMSNHIEKKQVYPTLVRRAQFYIDHEWFIEAGEELPVHKDTPRMGGDYPLMLTSGHNRWSVHSGQIANKMMLNTHRGRPHLVMNPEDAARRGLRDDEEVRVHNDVGEMMVHIKLSPGVRPGQVVCYTGWDPYQFRNWHGPSDVEGGMVKWLGMASGYGQTRFWPTMWQPWHADRGTRVEVSKID